MRELRGAGGDGGVGIDDDDDAGGLFWRRLDGGSEGAAFAAMG